MSEIYVRSSLTYLINKAIRNLFKLTIYKVIKEKLSFHNIIPECY